MFNKAECFLIHLPFEVNYLGDNFVKSGDICVLHSYPFCLSVGLICQLTSVDRKC